MPGTSNLNLAYYKPSNYPMNINWTEEEKAQLLEALQKYGASNIVAIAAKIPTRSVNQIKLAMNAYEQAAKRSLKDADTATSGKRDAPIDQWLGFFKDVMKENYKAADVATAFKYIALFEKHTETKDINLKDCYEFLADAMTGKAPKQLNKESMHFIMTCITKLAMTLKKQNTKKEEDFIMNLKLADITQKTYVNQNAPLVKDPVLNTLKIPQNLLKMD